MTANGVPARRSPEAMPKITYYVAASLDGYIADADGGVGWLPEGDAGDYGYEEFYSGVDALVMGRRTYDQVLEFGQWYYAGKPTYVFTSHPPDDNPFGVEFVSVPPAEFVQSVVARRFGAIWLLGGGNLAEQFRSAGLIDEYVVHLIPVVLGRGVPLFGGEAPLTVLRLETVEAYDDGVVMLRYLSVSG